ncbi:hypothetical protein [Rhodoflexus caldus]|jgi:hypothetical protein|uniref:hypothetical protein n=1 Tax=Rhodoflexus caldus TaxID=2891236 RepID=UPI002029C88D|nr:hypothetical protein [Rhodoflexus caldus]
MSKQPEKYQVFEKENEILRNAKELLAKPDMLPEHSWVKEYELLAQSYAQLLGEVKLLTSVSDRLQNKLNKANESIARKNDELTQTLDMLTKERVGKRATTIVLMLAALFFIISELVIDPQLQEGAKIFGASGLIMLKITVAIALKPLEVLLENLLLKTAARKKM